MRGATITGCVAAVAAAGYALAYTLNNQSYSLNYNWTTGGLHTFNLVAPVGTVMNTYTGTAPYAVPTATRAGSAAIYPNPSSQNFSLDLGPGVVERDVQDIAIYDQKGPLVYRTRQYQPTINPGPLASGAYAVKIRTAITARTNKLVVQ